MNKVVLDKFTMFYKKATEVTPACLLLMTKGDLSAITLTHWIKALSTGSLTALCMVILSFVKSNDKFYKNEYLLATLTSFITMIVDYNTHPSHYQGNFTEAIVTGIAAGVISIVMFKFWKNDK